MEVKSCISTYGRCICCQKPLIIDQITKNNLTEHKILMSHTHLARFIKKGNSIK